MENDEPEYHRSTVTVSLYPGPECDMDTLQSDAHDFASKMVDTNHVMVDIEREEHASFKPNE